MLAVSCKIASDKIENVTTVKSESGLYRHGSISYTQLFSFAGWRISD